MQIVATTYRYSGYMAAMCFKIKPTDWKGRGIERGVAQCRSHIARTTPLPPISPCHCDRDLISDPIADPAGSVAASYFRQRRQRGHDCVPTDYDYFPHELACRRTFLKHCKLGAASLPPSPFLRCVSHGLRAMVAGSPWRLVGELESELTCKLW